jgi:DNA-binding GntR family transcriptional regulator
MPAQENRARIFRNQNSDLDDDLLRRIPLGEQIKQIVIDAILDGELQPGDRVAAKSLADRLGVSQAPVREAIRDLVMLGFLENEHFKGTTVRSFSRKELQDVYTVRAALESLAAQLAAPRLTGKDVLALRDTLDRMIQAAQERDEAKMVRLDNEFHETIIRMSDNDLLYQVWRTVQFGYWTIVTARVSSYDLEELARRHEALLQALETGDPQTAMAAMRRHIEELGQPPEDY